jgi:MinD superfamily P-loop ATPase
MTRDTITPHAGLALVGEFAVGIGMMEAVDRELPEPGSGAGYKASEYIFPLVLMLNGGGRRLEDMRQIREDEGLREGNSGKLVTLIRQEACSIAEKEGLNYIIVDGSPGIGCPVIASITGADLVLVVTELTFSGRHDLLRVADLASYFRIPSLVCVNKWDLNPQITEQIEKEAEEHGVKAAGRIRYDRAITEAQIMKTSVVEYTGGAVSADIRAAWRNVVYTIG